MHGVHQFGQLVEALGAHQHPFLLPQLDGPAELADVALSHGVKVFLAPQALQWHWRWTGR